MTFGPFGRSSRLLAQGLRSKASPTKSLSAPPQGATRVARFLTLSARAIIVTDSAFLRGKDRDRRPIRVRTLVGFFNCATVKRQQTSCLLRAEDWFRLI